VTLTRKNRLIALTCATMAQHGIVLLLMGAVLPAVMHTFQISESTAGLMLGAGSFGFFLGPLVAGMLADRFDARTAMMVGLGAETALLLLLGAAPSLLAVTAVFFLLNFAAGFIETPVNMVPPLVESGHTGSLMNLIHMFFSVGAFISPLLAGLILQTIHDWRPVFWLTAVPTVVLFFLMGRSRFPATPRRTETQSAPNILTLLRERALLLGALAMFIYVGAELGASNWVVLYLQQGLGFPPLAAASGLSALWIGLMIGRYLNSLLAKRRSSRELVLGGGIGGLIVGLGLLTAATPLSVYAWLTALGLCMSGIYPNIMAALNGRNPARMGIVTGFLAEAAATGSMVAQPLLGLAAEGLGLRVAIGIPALLMGLMALAYLGTGEAGVSARQSEPLA
jgi:fucose permease